MSAVPMISMAAPGTANSNSIGVSNAPRHATLDRPAQKVGEHIVFVGSFAPHEHSLGRRDTLSAAQDFLESQRQLRIGDATMCMAKNHGCLGGEPCRRPLRIHVENRCGPQRP
jgi:hypothetical protein